MAASGGIRAQCLSVSDIGVANNSTNALLVLNSQDVLIGGSFTTIDGVAASRIARRAGSTWSPLGAGFSAGSVNSITQAANGSIYAAGQFASSGATIVNNIAVWNGVSWQALGSGLTAAQIQVPPAVDDLVVLTGGDLIVAGRFSESAGPPFVTLPHLARWNGSSWSTVAGGGIRYANGSLPEPNVLLSMPDGGFIVAGAFNRAGPSPGFVANNIARWSAGIWSALGSGLEDASFGEVRALLLMPNGDVIAGGDIDLAGGSPVGNIARWDGSLWHPLGAGTDGTIVDLALLPSGALLATGSFTTAGGQPAPGRATWDGNLWKPYLPQLTDSIVRSSVLLNGSIVHAGTLTGTFNTSIKIATKVSIQAGDANSDLVVDFSDVTSILSNFGASYAPGSNGPGDSDGDGVVQFADLSFTLANFGASCI